MGNFYLMNTKGLCLKKSVPSTKLKLCSNELFQDSSEESYEVEKILKHRMNKEQIEYLVKWKNYSSEENTWEPATSFDQESTISEYWKQLED